MSARFENAAFYFPKTALVRHCFHLQKQIRFIASKDLKTFLNSILRRQSKQLIPSSTNTDNGKPLSSFLSIKVTHVHTPFVKLGYVNPIRTGLILYQKKKKPWPITAQWFFNFGVHLKNNLGSLVTYTCPGISTEQHQGSPSMCIFNKLPKWFWCTSTFQTHYFGAFILLIFFITEYHFISLTNNSHEKC